MPIYEYRCDACGHYLEALQKLSEAPLKTCPECSESALTRLMSAPSFRLKGGGWYETDFKGDGEKKRNLVDGSDGTSKEPAAKDAASGDAAKKDTKDAPAAKPAKDKKPSKEASGKSEKAPAASSASG